MTPTLALLVLMAAPVIREIVPPGGQQGKAVKITLKGDALTPGAKVITSIPGGVTSLVGKDFTLLVELKPDAPVGLYPLRVLTEDGLSNLVLFSVGTLPEVEEQEEKHGERADAQAIKSPTTINATLDGPEIDYYAIDIAAPQKLVIEIDARRAGSAIDPAFEIEDAQGKVIARNDDAAGCGVDSRLQVQFAKPGRYYVRVHDSKYSAQLTNFYRLKIGQWSYAEALMPMAIAKGTKTSIQALGGNLAQPAIVEVEMPTAAVAAPVRVPGSASLPLMAVAVDKEDHSTDGRFEKPKQKHEMKLAVQPSESWVVEVFGKAAGASMAEPFITVLGPDGKKIASRDDIANPNLALPFTVPKDVKEVTVVIEDLLSGASPLHIFHAQVHRSPADFVAFLAAPFVNVPAGGTAIVPVEIRRRGYDGPIRVTLKDPPPGIQVGGGNIPSEAAAQSFNNDNAGFRTSRGMMTLTAAPNIDAKFTELKVIATAGDIVREVQGPAMSVTVRGLKQNAVTAPWLGTKLPFATARPLPVSLRASNYLVRISQGVEYPMTYRVERRAGAKPVIRVRDSQPSIVGNLRILAAEEKKDPDKGSLMLQTNFGSPITKFDMLMIADAEIDGKMQAIYAPAMEVDLVPGYQVLPKVEEIAIQPGAAFSIEGTILREPTFEGGPMKVEAQDLPEGVSCQAAEVAESAKEFSVSCQAAPGTLKGATEIRLTSAAPDVGKKAKAEYKGPDATLKLKVGN